MEELLNAKLRQPIQNREVITSFIKSNLRPSKTSNREKHIMKT